MNSSVKGNTVFLYYQLYFPTSLSYLGFWWEQGPAEAVHVAQVDLDTGVGEAQLVEAGGIVTGTNVTLAREGRDGDGVLQL